MNGRNLLDAMIQNYYNQQVAFNKFVAVSIGVAAFVIYRQGRKIKALENEVKILKDREG